MGSKKDNNPLGGQNDSPCKDYGRKMAESAMQKMAKEEARAREEARAKEAERARIEEEKAQIRADLSQAADQFIETCKSNGADVLDVVFMLARDADIDLSNADACPDADKMRLKLLLVSVLNKVFGRDDGWDGSDDKECQDGDDTTSGYTWEGCAGCRRCIIPDPGSNAGGFKYVKVSSYPCRFRGIVYYGIL